MRVLAISSFEDIPTGFTVISCGISGGTYESYLRSMIEAYSETVCLLLEPVVRRFTLPNYDGQGEPITEKELSEILSKYPARFTDALCTNYIFIPNPPMVVLFDDENSLRKKMKFAEQCNIPLLAADVGLIKKLRLPD